MPVSRHCSQATGRGAAGLDLASIFLGDEFMVGDALGAAGLGDEGGNPEDGNDSSDDNPENPSNPSSVDAPGTDSSPTMDAPNLEQKVQIEHDAQENGDNTGGGGNTNENGGCGQSFSADTLVATPEGEQSISSLQVGDQVQAYDSQTHQQSTQTVEQVWINNDTDLLDVTLQVVTTPKGQSTQQQESQQDSSSKSIASEGTPTKQANMQQSLTDSGKSPENASSDVTQEEMIQTTANHPWLTTDHGWMPAGNLRIGEPVVRADGKLAVVVAVHGVPGAGIRYDLTVSRIHTFEVGIGRWVVHNCTGDPPNYKDTTGTDTDQTPDEKDAGKYVATSKPDATVIQRDPPGEGALRKRDAYVGNTSDLTVDGVNYDITSPEPGTSVAQTLSAAAGKYTQARGIVINLSRTSLTAADFGDNVLNCQGRF